AAVVGPRPRALVERRLARAVIAHAESRSAVRARHQAGQEGWPGPDCAQRRGPGTVRLQAGAIGFVLLPGDVGRALVRDEGEPLARRHDDAPAPGPTGLVLARIVLPPPVDVGAGIQRVLEDLLERRPVR